MKDKEQISFLKNVGTLLSGSALSHVITLIALLITQRYFFGPEQLATYHWFFDFVMIFVSISALRLETGVILEEEDRKAVLLTRLSLKIVLISAFVGILFSIIYVQFNDNAANILNENWYFPLIFLAIVGFGYTQVLNAWYTRQEKFKLLALSKLVQTSSTGVSQITLGFVNLISSGLIIGRTIGSFLTSFVLYNKFIPSKREEKKPTSGETKELIKKNKDFIYFTTTGTLIGSLSNFLIVDLFLSYFGEELTGNLTSSRQYISMGLALVSSSFAQVFYSKIAKIKSKKELRSFYTYWLYRLSAIAAVILLVIQFIPEQLVISILGNKWSNLLEPMKIMSIWMCIMFVSSSMSYIYIKLKRQRIIILLDLIHLALSVLSISASYELHHNFITSLYWFTIAKSLFYFVTILLTYYFIDKFKGE